MVCLRFMAKTVCHFFYLLSRDNYVRRGLDKNLHRFRPWTQGQINDLGFPEPESSDLSARASPPKFLIPTLRKPRRVGQPQLGGAKGGPARLRKKSESRRFAASGAKALADFARLMRR